MVAVAPISQNKVGGPDSYSHPSFPAFLVRRLIVVMAIVTATGYLAAVICSSG